MNYIIGNKLTKGNGRRNMDSQMKLFITEAFLIFYDFFMPGIVKFISLSFFLSSFASSCHPLI